MQISIAERYRPFSHLPGTPFLLPGTSLRIKAFPALLRVENIVSAHPILLYELPLAVQGPVRDFTIEQDLERSHLRIWGSAVNGYFRYRLTGSSPDQIKVTIEKGEAQLEALCTIMSDKHVANFSPFERLSLGSQKAQDWELIQKRCNMNEIFPLWMRLGQLTPKTATARAGTATLLNHCESVIKQRECTSVLGAFEQVFMAGFEGGLSPTLFDERYQGFDYPSVRDEQVSPLTLLTEGAELIRALFIQEGSDFIEFLPLLPPAFHCGRMTQVASSFGKVDFEWSKKQIRRVRFFSSCKASVRFIFQKGVSRYRLRRSMQDKGVLMESATTIALEPDSEYLLDHF